MPTWIFLRHGESSANAGRWLAGWEDVPLTDLGRDQALSAGRSLAGWTFDSVLTSDLERARETARLAMASWTEATGRSPPAPTVLPELRERRLGEFARVALDELRADGRVELLLGWSTRPPGGESHDDLAARILPALARADRPGVHLVVAHGGVIRTALGLADGVPRPDIGRNRIPNAQATSRELPPGRWAELAREGRSPGAR